MNALPPSRPLFLCGMMGSGKTTVGVALAARMGVEFVDLDRRIEDMFGRSISELFEADESEFRNREGQALSSLLAEPGFCERAVVVATGGGTVLDSVNRTAMRGAGLLVFLDVPAEVLVERLSRSEVAQRPLLKHEGPQDLRGRLERLLLERGPSYDECQLRIDARGDAKAVADSILQALDTPDAS